jgi:hypothetical protein
MLKAFFTVASNCSSVNEAFWYEKFEYDDHGAFGRYRTSGVGKVSLHPKKVGCLFRL